jgi:hypothetical protein
MMIGEELSEGSNLGISTEYCLWWGTKVRFKINLSVKAILNDCPSEDLSNTHCVGACTAGKPVSDVCLAF